MRPQLPCQPSPCGPNAECQVVNGHEACSCLPSYTGRPPLCRPECVINAECPTHLACIQQKCKDPCIGACGIRAYCQVVNHNAICSCPTGFRGDPFAQCSEIPPSKILIFNQIIYFQYPGCVSLLQFYCKTVCIL